MQPVKRQSQDLTFPDWQLNSSSGISTGRLEIILSNSLISQKEENEAGNEEMTHPTNLLWPVLEGQLWD